SHLCAGSGSFYDQRSMPVIARMKGNDIVTPRKCTKGMIFANRLQPYRGVSIFITCDIAQAVAFSIRSVISLLKLLLILRYLCKKVVDILGLHGWLRHQVFNGKIVYFKLKSCLSG